MLFPLGLLAIVAAIVVAAWRTRPRWWMVLIGVLIVVGMLWSILGITGVTATLGHTAVSWIGWIYLGLCLSTLLAAVFVLERRGWNGEEAPAYLGDTPFDGDTDDSDDPTPATNLR